MEDDIFKRPANSGWFWICVSVALPQAYPYRICSNLYLEGRRLPFPASDSIVSTLSFLIDVSSLPVASLLQ
jgi:hypothetical protein